MVHLVRHRREIEGARHVGDIEKIAPLGAVADDGEGLARELLREKNAEDRAVSARGFRARAVGVEDADAVDRELVGAAPVQHGFLAQVFAQRVGMLAGDGCILARGHGGEAVAGGRGGIDELPHLRVPGALKHFHRAHDIRAEIIHRAFDGRHDVTDAAEMDDVARAGEERVVRREVADVADLDDEVGIALVLLEIFEASADEAVDDVDAVAFGEEQIHHVAADEAGASGDNGDGFVGHGEVGGVELNVARHSNVETTDCWQRFDSRHWNVELPEPQFFHALHVHERLVGQRVAGEFAGLERAAEVAHGVFDGALGTPAEHLLDLARGDAIGARVVR